MTNRKSLWAFHWHQDRWPLTAVRSNSLGISRDFACLGATTWNIVVRQMALPAFEWDHSHTTQCCRAFTLALARLSCWDICIYILVRTDGRTDGNASKSVYPPVSLRSLGGYNYWYMGITSVWPVPAVLLFLFFFPSTKQYPQIHLGPYRKLGLTQNA